MDEKMMIQSVSALPTSHDFTDKVTRAIQASSASGRPFFILVIELANLDMFQKRRSAVVVNSLFREVSQNVRKAVHPSQFVGRYQNGLGLVFDAVDVGHVDTVAKKLIFLLQNVIRAGKYNDLNGRWSDILYQFLKPNNPGIILPKVGWAIYPRDGNTSQALINRAQLHLKELNR